MERIKSMFKVNGWESDDYVFAGFMGLLIVYVPLLLILVSL